MNVTYRVHVELNWGKQWARQEHTDFFAADFDDDEQLCRAVAANLLEAIKSGRNYLLTIEGEEDDAVDTI